MICDLAYVNKSVNAGNDLRKSAEGHKAYDLDVRGIADLILVVENEPRIGILGLVSERDSALLAVDRLYEHLDNIADLDDLGGMMDSSPGKLGEMYHSVNAAEVNECAVRGQALNGSFIDRTLFNGIPECLLLCLALLACNRTDGSVSAAALILDLDDLHALGRSDKCGKVSVARDSGLRCGDEYAVGIERNDNSSLYSLDNLALKNLAAFVSRDYVFPILIGINALFRKGRNTVNVAYFDYECFNFVAELEHIFKLCRLIVGYLIA